MHPLIAKVLFIAKSQVGVREHGGNNHGPEVEQYLRAVGLGAGQPWCAAFVAWCMAAAGVDEWPATGDTWALEDWARAKGILHDAPAAGDVFLLLGGDGRPMHTGFVTAASPERAETVEGNTGGPSDTDGDGVFAKSRWPGACRFIRWAYLPGLAEAPHAEPRRAFLWWHDGKGALKLPDGTVLPVRGVRVNGTPWAGGEIVVGL